MQENKFEKKCKKWGGGNDLTFAAFLGKSLAWVTLMSSYLTTSLLRRLHRHWESLAMIEIRAEQQDFANPFVEQARTP
jgi:hypothetical protein